MKRIIFIFLILTFLSFSCKEKNPVIDKNPERYENTKSIQHGRSVSANIPAGKILIIKRHEETGKHLLYRINTDGSDLICLNEWYLDMPGKIDSPAYPKWSPDGKRLVTGDADGTVIIWDGATGEALTTLKGHKGIAYAAIFSPGGEKLVSAGEDGIARLWDAEDKSVTERSA